MRILPADIRAKLLERFQVESADAKPKLRVIATQAAVNTLLTEDIHGDAAAGFGDIAVRQLPGERSPSMAYAFCIDGGMAKVYERAFPAELENPWVLAWTFGAAKDVAIEYNGVWTLEPRTRCYELITDEFPYIFFTDASNQLYVQKWRDETTRMPLAGNATNISVCRGWKSNLDIGVDQGLVIGYLRAGKVYYRVYSEQSDGTLIWEAEREVTELGTGNSTLAIFRTNDFRLGFIIENEGEIKYVLTYRTYAGQAMPPEHADTQIRNASVYVDEAVFHDVIHRERVNADVENVYFAICPVDAELAIVGAERVDDMTLLATFGESIGGDFVDHISILPEREVLSATIQNNNKLLMSMNAAIGRATPITFTVNSNRDTYWLINGMRMAMDTLVYELPGQPNEAFLREYAETSISGLTDIYPAVFHGVRLMESVEAAILSASFVLQPVSISPI